MNVLIAPDSFKGSLSAEEVGQAAARGIDKADPSAKTTVVPMADGGEGSIDALRPVLTKEIPLTVTGPSGKPVETSYAIIENDGTATVFIECARSTGLTLIEDSERDPFQLNSYGLGEQIRHAAEQGYRQITVSLGGSATTDGGTGMLQALGYRFFDKKDEMLSTGTNPLGHIASVDDSEKVSALDDCQITVACDVTNPFHGTNGAAHIYGPQKGATPDQVHELDHGLEQFADIIETKYGVDLQQIPGAGAAGGLGGALAGVLGATLEPGFDIIAELTGLEEKIKEADVVLTGEGSLDTQSSQGKVPMSVGKMAKAHGKPVIAIAGKVDADDFHSTLDAAFSIQRGPGSLEEALDPEKARENIAYTVEQIMRVFVGDGSRV
ncbi:glycerate kinase family protein [Halobacillus salinus]|uniref:glycerate kinase family protein n=1 Tax=Halobacillus salinus TaxID=192814 RepID=UPI0009A58A3F|nr:glycerate kinase [Halobacillus salinus]